MQDAEPRCLCVTVCTLCKCTWQCPTAHISVPHRDYFATALYNLTYSSGLTVAATRSVAPHLKSN